MTLTQESSTRNGGYTNNFAYDGGTYTAITGVGNPTTMRGSSMSYNSDNQITTNTYDGDGIPISYNGHVLSFDPEDRMTTYGSAQTNVYNGDDHRTKILTAAGTSYYICDGNQPFLTEDTTGTITKVTTFRLAGTISSHTSASFFYTWDPQGSICQKIDATGAVTYSRIYDAFGNVVKTDSDTDSYASFGGQWGYFLDSATGLEQLGHRFYDPAVGRFINRDPFGLAGGINLYNYTKNNPVNGIDPTGYCAIAIPIVIGIVCPECLLGVGLGLIAAGLIFALADSAPADTDNDGCDEEWASARAKCAEIQRQNDQDPIRNIKGPYDYPDIDGCAKGLVSERCGGNPIDMGKSARQTTWVFP